MNITRESAVAGAVYGLAFGDAAGYRHEFKSYGQIMHEKPEFPEKAVISDDTQMSLYLLGSLARLKSMGFSLQAPNPSNEEHFREWANKVRTSIMDDFVLWENDPRNDRAPGLTCTAAVRNYAGGSKRSGLGGTVMESMGNGTTMRAPWIGLLSGLTENDVAILAQLSAEVTHGHVEAGPAASLTALTMWHLLHTSGFRELSTEELFDWAKAKAFSYAHEDFWTWRGERNDSEAGFTMLMKRLEEAKELIPQYKSYDKGDIADVWGSGAIAPESFIISLLILGQAKSPEEGIKRLVYTRGDSDTIGAIGGSLLGAKWGIEAFDPTWEPRLEEDYKQELRGAAAWLKNN